MSMSSAIKIKFETFYPEAKRFLLWVISVFLNFVLGFFTRTSEFVHSILIFRNFVVFIYKIDNLQISVITRRSLQI